MINGFSNPFSALESESKRKRLQQYPHALPLTAL
jgi:hypothetical protein